MNAVTMKTDSKKSNSWPENMVINLSKHSATSVVQKDLSMTTKVYDSLETKYISENSLKVTANSNKCKKDTVKKLSDEGQETFLLPGSFSKSSESVSNVNYGEENSSMLIKTCTNLNTQKTTINPEPKEDSIVHDKAFEIKEIRNNILDILKNCQSGGSEFSTPGEHSPASTQQEEQDLAQTDSQRVDHTDDTIPTTYQCEICSQTFASLNCLRKHKVTHIALRPFGCRFCPKTFARTSDYTKHISVHTGEKPYLCTTCNARFTRQLDLVRHMITHNNGDEKTCELCQKTFACEFFLMKHLKRHGTLKPFSCEVCGKKFAEKSDIKRHVKTHLNERPVFCDICFKRFACSTNLMRHMRIHTGEKPFNCEVCPRSFTSNSTLREHRRIHTGEKPFTCEVCHYNFAHSSSLQKHLRRHTGEKPFSCKLCPKKFSSNSNFVKHKRVHEAREERERQLSQNLTRN